MLQSVYELDTDLGLFDFVFCGDLLVHLKDPITAVENISNVCRDSATIANPVTRVRFGRRRPIAQLDGIDFFQCRSRNSTGSTSFSGGPSPTKLSRG